MSDNTLLACALALTALTIIGHNIMFGGLG